MIRKRMYMTLAAAIAIPLAGCASTSEADGHASTTVYPLPPHDEASYAAHDPVAARMVAQMDAAPPERRVPNWNNTRELMMRRAPEVGAPAPDFTLKTRDGTDTIKLSALYESKPVVLVFGSWT